MKKSNFKNPALYFNRELSSLEFNRRVLALAKDASIPLLERLRFITILSSNLDEFFEVRVAGVQQRLALGLSMRTPDQMSPLSLHERIVSTVREIVAEQYRILNHDIFPALEEKGIRLLKRQSWTEVQQAWAETYFMEQILPVLTPLGLDPAHPFPNVQNKSLNFIISLEGTDDFGRDGGVAILPVPRCLPRIIALPKSLAEAQDSVLLSSIIHANVHRIFSGMEVSGCYQFRFLRGSRFDQFLVLVNRRQF